MGDATGGTVQGRCRGRGECWCDPCLCLPHPWGRAAVMRPERDKVEAEVLDLRHGLQFVPRADVVGSDDIAVCAGADVVAITAGAKQKPGQTRLDLAGTNLEMCRSLVPSSWRSRRGPGDGDQPGRRAHLCRAQVLRPAGPPGVRDRHGP